ncbi:MAG: glycosyltransferase family 4 protein, partial [Acidiferrobacterales bacterium]
RSERNSAREELGLAPSDFALCFVANEFERKGLRSLLAAMRILFQDHFKCHLIVAGNDSAAPYQSELTNIESFVHFLGHRQDIDRIYAAADVFVLPTNYDLSPLVGLEALAAGLLLLMTPIGGIRDYLQEGATGYFIKPDPADTPTRSSHS